MVLGGDSAGVQGVDYAYTLQGWLKGVNSTAATASGDMGLDGYDSGHKVARDVYGYSLGYYDGDYTPIGGSGYNAFALKYNAVAGGITGQSLYNGNIGNSTLAIDCQLFQSLNILTKVTRKLNFIHFLKLVLCKVIFICFFI